MFEPTLTMSSWGGSIQHILNGVITWMWIPFLVNFPLGQISHWCREQGWLIDLWESVPHGCTGPLCLVGICGGFWIILHQPVHSEPKATVPFLVTPTHFSNGKLEINHTNITLFNTSLGVSLHKGEILLAREAFFRTLIWLVRAHRYPEHIAPAVFWLALS